MTLWGAACGFKDQRSCGRERELWQHTYRMMTFSFASSSSCWNRHSCADLQSAWRCPFDTPHVTHLARSLDRHHRWPIGSSVFEVEERVLTIVLEPAAGDGRFRHLDREKRLHGVDVELRKEMLIDRSAPFPPFPRDSVSRRNGPVESPSCASYWVRFPLPTFRLRWIIGCSWRLRVHSAHVGRKRGIAARESVFGNELITGWA